MIGAIVGDITGSIYEFRGSPKSKVFPLWSPGMHYTDDSALSVAVADVLNAHTPLDLHPSSILSMQKDLISAFVYYAKHYAVSCYGGMFKRWVYGDSHLPYQSFGNGAAMRISAVGWAAQSEEEVRILSRAVTEITHDHPEGLKGAEATAMSIFLAKTGSAKQDIESYVLSHYYPDMKELSFENLIAHYHFEPSCQKTVPEALLAFLGSDSFEDCLRRAVAIGGDCDTLSAIACSVAEAYYPVDEGWKAKVYTYLPKEFIAVLDRFDSLYENGDRQRH